MGKEVYKLEQFHGGLNNNSDPRDIEQNEFSVCSGVAVDELGIIRLIGAPNSSSKITVEASATPGSGLISYKTDKSYTATDSPTEWLGIFNEDDGTIDVSYDGVNIANGNNTFDSQSTAQPGASFIDVATDNSSGKPSYYSAEGRLRICDSNFANTSGQSLTPQSSGYLRLNLFHTTDEKTSEGTPIHKIGKWHSTDQSLKTLETILGGNGNIDIVDATTSSPNATALGDGSTKKFIMAYWRTEGGSWNGVFEFGFCAVYEGDQESSISIADTTIGLSNERLHTQFFIPMGTASTITSNSGHLLGDDRVIGVNVYFRPYGADDFDLLTKVDLRSGGKFHWKTYNSATETGHGIWDSSGSDAFSLTFTTNGSTASATDSFDETTVGVSMTVNSNGFSGRKGFVRLYGFEPSPIYHPLSTIATDSHVPISVRNPAPGTKKFQAQLLDERFNLIVESGELERTITDSGADNPEEDRREDAERTNQGS
tara:strand:+ start:1298 stop:2749 length:1452 start_codon:yes stop_codon:yes gene_type:complete